MELALGATPADLGGMDTLSVSADVLASAFSNDTCSLTAKISHATSGDFTDTVTLGTEADSVRTQRSPAFTDLAKGGALGA